MKSSGWYGHAGPEAAKQGTVAEPIPSDRYRRAAACRSDRRTHRQNIWGVVVRHRDQAGLDKIKMVARHGQADATSYVGCRRQADNFLARDKCRRNKTTLFVSKFAGHGTAVNEAFAKDRNGRAPCRRNRARRRSVQSDGWNKCVQHLLLARVGAVVIRDSDRKRTLLDGCQRALNESRRKKLCWRWPPPQSRASRYVHR